MNKRLGAVLAFAFVVSLTASFIIYQLVSMQVSDDDVGDTTTVLVAARDLEVGELLQEGDVQESQWVGAPPQQAVLNAEEVVGRGVVQNIYAGEPILRDRLAREGAGAGLTATIPKGMRAVALPVNSVSGVSGFVVPGQRVDVLISGVPPNMDTSKLGTISTTLLQNVEVLSAGQEIKKDEEGKPISVPVINLLVTPEDAEILSLASSQTRLQLVLRNPIDTDEAEPPGTATARLYDNARFLNRPAPEPRPVTRGLPGTVRRAAPPKPEMPPPPPIQPRGPLVVEVYHGVKKSQSTFTGEQEQ